MTILASLENNSIQTTSSTTFTEMLSKDFTLEVDGRNHRILVSCEFTIDNKNDIAEVEVLLDSTQVDIDSFSPFASANEPHKFSTMILCLQGGSFALDSGLHNIKLNARSVGGNQVSVRRARLSVDRF